LSICLLCFVLSALAILYNRLPLAAARCFFGCLKFYLLLIINHLIYCALQLAVFVAGAALLDFVDRGRLFSVRVRSAFGRSGIIY
jgi:hypothetical protein